MGIAEILMVHTDTAVVANFGQFLFNQRQVLWPSVRREAHDFVFAAVNFESGVVRERAVEQTETVGKAQLFQQSDLIPATDTDRTRGPLADAIDCQNRSLFKRRRIKRAGGVTLVMIAEQQLPFEFLAGLFRMTFIFDAVRLGHFGVNQIRHPQLLFHPQRHRFDERAKS